MDPVKKRRKAVANSSSCVACGCCCGSCKR